MSELLASCQLVFIVKLTTNIRHEIGRNNILTDYYSKANFTENMEDLNYEQIGLRYSQEHADKFERSNRLYLSEFLSKFLKECSICSNPGLLEISGFEIFLSITKSKCI